MSRLTEALAHINPGDIDDWSAIDALLTSLQRLPSPTQPDWESFRSRAASGIAFLTFDFGIDGVSIEISKYAKALEGLYPDQADSLIHVIGGDFYPQADSVLQPHWTRFRIAGINGWSKWDNGQWFSRLYYEDMPAGSPRSRELAQEMLKQALHIAGELGAYIEANDIALLIPVNIHSNPGNLALALASVMVTEILDLIVINSNHDFYWEGGKPASERTPDEAPGVRDHFFRNVDNAPFFNLLQRLYPWRSPHWLQVNINRLQSNRLMSSFGFAPADVHELSTSISDRFLEPYTRDDVRHARLRMAHILSDGKGVLRTTALASHLRDLTTWMQDQRPCVLGIEDGLQVDPTSTQLLYLLQPTRVIARKRIEKDVHLIHALLEHAPFKTAFEENDALQLVLHITGPTPIEHQADLETVLHAYRDMLESLPRTTAERVMIAFSVGNEYHPSFKQKGFEPLSIESIYRMASAVVFPSQTEGRGLPIVEASASRVPLICSRYEPGEVFAGVVGEGLPDEQQIQYTLFPEGDFSKAFLDEVSQLLLKPENAQEQLDHNFQAVRLRYRTQAMSQAFEDLLRSLWKKAGT